MLMKRNYTKNLKLKENRKRVFTKNKEKEKKPMEIKIKIRNFGQLKESKSSKTTG
jgi:hypothetical protein